jgi:NADPH-dependent 2,4-dienoyl-CoA reductase/sulfur reductase-like enzyme/ferredoxin
LKLVPSPTGLSLVDLGSRNGTLVNGARVTGRVVLEPGDTVRLGKTEFSVLARSPGAGLAVSEQTQIVDLGADAPAPPKPAPARRPPGPVSLRVRRLGRAIAGTGGRPFLNYTELPTIVPRRAWHAVRIVSVAAYVALCAALFIRPAGGQFAFFKVIVPLLPILFFVAPGLWRNVCPLAASNQTPRVFGFTRGLDAPAWLAKRAYVIAITLFLGIAAARLAVFNTNAAATGVLLSVTIVNAFVAGFLLKGKSGWCSSICPLLPLQRVYGQTPFVTVPNSHCSPCVACAKNCYDRNPRVAYQADLHDPDAVWSAPRRLFAAILPGFVLGFFTLVGHSEMSRLHVYEHLAIYVLVSVGSFFALDALLPLTSSMLTAVYGALAINIFYWYSSVTLVKSFATITGVSVPWASWPIRAAVLLLAIVWLAHTHYAERRFELESALGLEAAEPQPVSLSRRPALPKTGDGAEEVEVRFMPDDKSVSAELGVSLLEVAEGEGHALEAGCRMGVCGADPIAVLAGMEALSPVDEEERSTLRRLGLGATTRMACCARLEGGPVTICLTPEPGGTSDTAASVHFDRSLVSVVVLGNGIAGVTAADFIRRGHPECEIHVVGRESHVLYNRMAISRLIYGRSAMQGLYLLPEQWYDDHGVTGWLNTQASKIDLPSRRVFLGTGDVLSFDRLVLAMGSSSADPRITGFGRAGTFVLREAGDAMRIRAYAQEHQCRDAVVAGGGLLGLEGAHALSELGLRVKVLERGRRLLAKQIDPRGSELVEAHFNGLGIEIVYQAQTAAIDGTERIERIRLEDGRTLGCDVFLACVGISPNVALAREAGIAVNRGVIVDDHMQTSAPDVYAAGDVAEHGGNVFGLWPIATKQAEVAAVNLLGGDRTLDAEIPATILKGVGLELTSVGRYEASEGDTVITLDDPARSSYRRLVISNGRAVGMVIIGHYPEDVPAATTAVKRRAEIPDGVLDDLRSGDWSPLRGGTRASAR